MTHSVSDASASETPFAAYLCRPMCLERFSPYRIVKVADDTALKELPLAIATAFSVIDEPAAIFPVYLVEALVGVVPLVV